MLKRWERSIDAACLPPSLSSPPVRTDRRTFMWKACPFSRIPPLGLDVQLSVALSRHCRLWWLCVWMGGSVRHCRLMVLECGSTSEHTAQPATQSGKPAQHTQEHSRMPKLSPTIVSSRRPTHLARRQLPVRDSDGSGVVATQGRLRRGGSRHAGEEEGEQAQAAVAS